MTKKDFSGISKEFRIDL